MDRTKEFFAFYDSVLSRRLKGNKKAGFTENARGYIDKAPGTRRWPSQMRQPSRKSAGNGDYFKIITQVGEGINSCKVKLLSLLKYVNRKTLFDDQPAKINELVSIIKKDLEQIGGGLVAASKIMSENASPDIGAPGTQARQHVKNILGCLEADFSKIKEEFKRILDMRSRNLNEQRLRKQEYFYHSPDQGPANKYYPIPNSARNDDASKTSTSLRERLKPGSKSSMMSGRLTDAHSSESNISHTSRNAQSAQLLQQMKAPSRSNLDAEIAGSRSKEIDLIEATVIELGQMYQNFSNMVTLQGQSIRRIDDNLNDVELSMSGAHSQLAKYYKSVSSNRWFIIKILAVLLFFFLIFIIVT